MGLLMKRNNFVTQKEYLLKDGSTLMSTTNTQSYISYANSAFIEASGYEEGELMGDMLTQMDENDRLSTTFRFRTGSSKLDERGRLDMQRLISYLERAPEGTEVTFVCFTDDVGAFDANQRLAEQRAAAVMDEMRAITGAQRSALA